MTWKDFYTAIQSSSQYLDANVTVMFDFTNQQALFTAIHGKYRASGTVTMYHNRTVVTELANLNFEAFNDVSFITAYASMVQHMAYAKGLK